MALLPPEITDRIIDFLHDDHKALRACCLVCRKWVPSSRTHIFWTIVLRSRRHLSLFTRLLYSAPQAGLYVRDLSLYGLRLFQDGVEILCRRLKNLSKLHLLDMSEIRSDMFVRLCSSLPCLTTLSLDTSFFSFGARDKCSFPVPNKIQSLRIATPDPKFFEWSIHRNIFPRILSFELGDSTVFGRPATEYFVTLYKFFQEYRLSLVHVQLDNLRNIPSEQLFDCLGLLANLRHLFVRVNDLLIEPSQASGERYERWHISDIPRLLDCITSRSLMSISWGIKFHKPDEYIDTYKDFDTGFTQMWEEVCRMLVTPRFSTVKTVGLSVGTYLFDNKRRYFQPLLAFEENGHVKLFWMDPGSQRYWPYADSGGEKWKQMVFGSPR